MRHARDGVPEAISGPPKWQIVKDEFICLQSAGARFGAVLADAVYGKVANFRQKLAKHGLTWAVGILPTQRVYPANLVIAPAVKRRTGQPARHPVPSARTCSVQAAVAALPHECWRTLSWRLGTKAISRPTLPRPGSG